LKVVGKKNRRRGKLVETRGCPSTQKRVDNKRLRWGGGGGGGGTRVRNWENNRLSGWVGRERSESECNESSGG